MEIAKKYGVKNAENIIEKSISIVSNYHHYAKQAEIEDEWINKIQNEITERIKSLDC